MISGISPAALAANIPSAISVDPSGHVIASDGTTNRTPKFSITANDEFIPAGVGIDPQGHVFVSDFANNRILKFSNTGHFIREWGTFGSENGQFNSPFQVAVDSQGNVFIADIFNNRIQKFSNTGTFIAKWGTEGSGDGQFDKPFGVAVDPQGHVFVADTLNQRVQKFSNNGTFIRTWGTFGSSPGQFDRPIDLAVDPQGHVFTVEFGGDRVQKFSNTGKFIRTWGKTGSNDSEFNAPVGIGIDPQGHVFTSEQSPNNRVQKFSNTGNFIRKWGSTGSDNGLFQNPEGVAVDPQGHVFVSDTSNNRVQKFSNTGGFIRTWNSTSSGGGGAELAIVLDPTSGPVGSTVTITGTGFAPNIPVAIKFDNVLVATDPATVTTNNNGEFTARITVPNTPPGAHTISANVVSKQFTVEPINENPGISISPTSGPVGTTVDITGTSFAPTSTITIEFDGTPVATNPSTVTSTPGGFFTATFNVPPSSNGDHTVKATQGSNSASNTFTVTSSTLATSQSSSPNLSEKMIVPDIFS